MATKNNPGPHSCYDKADPDEPLFTLLGRDPCAPFVVIFWCKMRALLGKDPAQIEEAGACAEAMRDWAMKLGKNDQIVAAIEAFRMACFEVAKAELEAKQVEPSPEDV